MIPTPRVVSAMYACHALSNMRHALHNLRHVLRNTLQVKDQRTGAGRFLWSAFE